MKRRELLKTGGAAVVLSSGVGNFALAQGAPIIDDMILGDANAPVEIIEYASFTCPHCARFHSDVFPQLKTDYIETNKVKFIHREVFFDRFGLWASMIARCAGTGSAYFAMAGLFYDTQSEWAGSGDPATVIAELRRIAKTAGMTDAELDACMADAAKAQALVDWYQANAGTDNITATPSFLIDGAAHSNMSYDQFKGIIDAKLDA